jgi:hypothetical protein
VKVLLSILVSLSTFGCSRKPIADLVREIDIPRQEFIDYYKVHGAFPAEDVGAVDARFQNRGHTWNGWHYSSYGSGYMLMNYTGRGREALWFICDPKDRASSGWYLDEDDGNPPASFALNIVEESVLDHINPTQP